jgi:hypothetical protein
VSSVVVRAFAAVVAVVVAALTPGPAMAMAEEPLWHRATCFTGVIDSIEVTADAQAVLTLGGHLDCGTRDKLATFGYARYDSSSEQGYLTRADMRRYRQTAPSPFQEGRFVEFGPVDFAICVVTDYDLPVACVQVTRSGWTSELEVTPLYADKGSPYIRTVAIVDENHERPACGGCW